MSPTGTKQATPLAELRRLETAEAKAKEVHSQIGRELTAAERRLNGYLDEPGVLSELGRLRRREPAMFDESGAPKGNSPAAELQSEIDALVAKIAELRPQYEQAGRLLTNATEVREAFTADNLSELLHDPALVAEAETVRDEANEAAALAEAAMDRYVQFNLRVQALSTSHHDRRGTRVPGLDAAADYRRTLESVDLPVPLPELS